MKYLINWEIIARFKMKVCYLSPPSTEEVLVETGPRYNLRRYTQFKKNNDKIAHYGGETLTFLGSRKRDTLHQRNKLQQANLKIHIWKPKKYCFQVTEKVFDITWLLITFLKYCISHGLSFLYHKYSTYLV